VAPPTGPGGLVICIVWAVDVFIVVDVHLVVVDFNEVQRVAKVLGAVPIRITGDGPVSIASAGTTESKDGIESVGVCTVRAPRIYACVDREGRVSRQKSNEGREGSGAKGAVRRGCG
jgi:hypothetical protein